MADFLAAVKAARVQHTMTSEPALDHPHIQESTQHHAKKSQQKVTASSVDQTKSSCEVIPIPTTPEDALKVLCAEPEADTLIATLKRLSSHDGLFAAFHLASPGPLQAQIVNALLTTIIPTFWATLNPKSQALLTGCMTSIAGFNALFSRLRLLCDTVAASQNIGYQAVQDLLEVADHLLRGDDCVVRLWTPLEEAVTTELKRDLIWKEAINLLGSGKIVAIAAQAEDKLREKHTRIPATTNLLSSGTEYAGWLGRNIAALTLTQGSNISSTNKEAAALLLAKALNLGYPLSVVSGLLRCLYANDLQTSSGTSSIQYLTVYLPSHVKAKLLEHTMHWLSTITPETVPRNIQVSATENRTVSAIGAYLVTILSTDKAMISHLIAIASDAVLLSTLSLSVRRACLAAISECAADEVQSLLEQTLTVFGDRMFIEHAPILQQDCLAQTLLLAAGYLNRKTPMAVLLSARSSGHMKGVSNRLDALSQRARWLGMVVGTALSSLVDKNGSRMQFDLDEMKSEETRWYLGLVDPNDDIGDLTEFGKLLQCPTHPVTLRQKHVARPREEAPQLLNGKPVFGPPRPSRPTQTEVIGEKVTEIFDDEDKDDDDADDLQPYAKPDSDPEDSDEDATLVNRNRPKPPVYIRTLMDMLRDDKSHDRFRLGLAHAAPLIRRKTSFGAEVRDHAEELMRMLCNLQDPFDTDDFDELRLQAIIAVLLSNVEVLAPWLSRQVFIGDYSIAQRSVMLSALGLGGRELAGLKGEDLVLNPSQPATSFPSKQLPPRLHALYDSNKTSTKQLESATQMLEHQLIKPMALQAADQSTAHLNAVKVRTFSSRIDVERTKRKPTANQLAKILGPAFVYPLITHYQQDIAAHGPSSVFSSTSFVLMTFLKTIALLLHASGPATLGLFDVTAAFWDLMLSVRVQAVGDKGVLEAVLFSLLTLLEVNTEKRRLAEEHPKQLMETQQWVEVVFERMGGGEVISGGKNEEAKVRTLAAGVLVKIREVIQAYQQRLFGQVLA